ncbi:MAG TPA: GNAT family N-acetyltransferase [Verrucomicrobiae bacterium]|nr:GNAT family N-acetyltransferase [Verrucomicrobiae bacterium]
MTIEEVGAEDAGRVFDLALALMRDLEDGDAELVASRRAEILAAWARDPQMMHAVVASERGEPLGIATLTEAFAIYARGRFAILSELYVAPAARSRGVGAALLDAVKALGRRRGWTRIELTASPSRNHERSVRFYERNGFVVTGPRFKFVLRSAEER